MWRVPRMIRLLVIPLGFIAIKLASKISKEIFEGDDGK